MVGVRVLDSDNSVTTHGEALAGTQAPAHATGSMWAVTHPNASPHLPCHDTRSAATLLRVMLPEDGGSLDMVLWLTL